ncbi:MAG: proline--tRNA ligase [Thermoprotei archaeon]|nr:MAG: proline--tRNA ligase [Thermoprotei archaeon]RLF25318.1 MAG: proline--tRNA ligase [Thermoprotei archaeon]
MVEISRTKWSTDFSKWFRDVISQAEVYDYRYPVKGVGVWPPYGMKIRNNVITLMKRLLDESGHEEVLFPMLIPEDLLRKEAEHIAKFEEEVFWVTHGGKRPLERRLALRPTSETAIMAMFKLWIKDHTDLPLKVYQIVNVFRYETKATHPMIRVREVTTFKEAHTAHATFEDAERQVKEAVEIYKRFFDELCIPYMISLRPEWDKFAGAVYSIAFDTLLPDGRALQIGTVHHLGQNFAKAFEVTYLKPDGTHEYVYTTSYGISERVIAALIAIHGDDHGLVLPPHVAPIQIVIVPIPYKGVEKEVYKTCEEVYKELLKHGFRVVYDKREDITPGEKYYYWELKGVPIRIEIGPRNLKENTATISRRDTLDRKDIPLDRLIYELKKLMDDIKQSLYDRAWKWLRSRVGIVEDIEQAKDIVTKRQGVAVVPWCGSESCGLEIEERTEGRVLGVPLDEKYDVKGRRCIICGREAKHMIRVCKTY